MQCLIEKDGKALYSPACQLLPQSGSEGPTFLFMHNVNHSRLDSSSLYLSVSLKPFINSAIENVFELYWTSEQACSPVWNHSACRSVPN